MVAGPPCSNCGWILRWVPEQNAWGCDRCRAMFPAGPPAQQAQPAPQAQPVVQSGAGWVRPHLGTTPGAFGGSAASSSPARVNSSPPQQHTAPAQPSYPQQQSPYAQPQNAYPQAQQPQPPAQTPPHGGYPPNVYGQPGAQSAAAPVGPPKKSKRGLLIAIGGVVAIGAGIAIAVGVSGGKKKGAGSRDEVIQGTLAALGASDSDALIALTAPELESDVLECEPDAQRDDDKALTRLRENSAKAIEKAKGLEVELVKTTDGKKKVREKGSSATKGCKLKIDVTMHEVELVLKVKKGSLTKERTKPMSVVEVDGRWFLGRPPAIEAPGDCKAAGKRTARNGREAYEKQGLGDAGLARIEKATTQHCVEDVWPDDVIICFSDAKSDAENGKCIELMPESARSKLIRHLTQIVTEDVKSREVPVVVTRPTTPPPDPTAPPGPGVGSGSGSAAAVNEEIPPICNDYLAEIEKLTKCRRVSVGIRQGQRTRYDLIVKGWQDARKKEAIRESTEKLCKTGVDIVLDLRKTQCR